MIESCISCGTEHLYDGDPGEFTGVVPWRCRRCPQRMLTIWIDGKSKIIEMPEHIEAAFLLFQSLSRNELTDEEIIKRVRNRLKDLPEHVSWGFTNLF